MGLADIHELQNVCGRPPRRVQDRWHSHRRRHPPCGGYPAGSNVLFASHWLRRARGGRRFARYATA